MTRAFGKYLGWISGFMNFDLPLRVHAHALFVARHVFKFDKAGGGGEQGVVATEADVFARMELRAMLAHDDHTGLDLLPVIQLDAEALPATVSTVAAAAAAFFVCHFYDSFAPGRVMPVIWTRVSWARLPTRRR